MMHNLLLSSPIIFPKEERIMVYLIYDLEDQKYGIHLKIILKHVPLRVNSKVNSK